MNIYWIYNCTTGLNCVSTCCVHNNHSKYLNLKLDRLISIILKMQMVLYLYSSLSEFSPDLKKYNFVLLIFMTFKLLLSFLKTKMICLSMVSIPVFKQLHCITKLFLSLCNFCERKSYLSESYKLLH